jgi:hypothetical protein
MLLKKRTRTMTRTCKRIPCWPYRQSLFSRVVRIETVVIGKHYKNRFFEEKADFSLEKIECGGLMGVESTSSLVSIFTQK